MGAKGTECAALQPDQWSLTGDWIIQSDHAEAVKAGDRLTYRFRDGGLHLVMGSGAGNKPNRFRVRVDGAAPGPDAGMDIDPVGNGVIDSQRLYQLVRQARSMRDRTVEIEFLDSGAQVFAFTFG